MDLLHLRGLQFYGRHGTEAWEKEVGRRFEVDVELSLDMTQCGQSDKLEEAQDYRQVYETVRRVVEDESHELIERVAWRILEALICGFPAVGAVRVRVHKPEAPIGGINRDVVADIQRTRQQLGFK